MPAELPPSIAFMLDEFRGEKFTLEDVSKSLSDKAFVRDYFDQCLASIGTFKYADDIRSRPDKFDIFAGNGLDPLSFGGKSPELQPVLSSTHHFARTACLYADRVVVPDPFSFTYIEATAEEIFLSLKVLQVLRPLLDAGIVVFAPEAYVACGSCTKVTNKAKKQVASQLWHQFANADPNLFRYRDGRRWRISFGSPLLAQQRISLPATREAMAATKPNELLRGRNAMALVRRYKEALQRHFNFCAHSVVFDSFIGSRCNATVVTDSPEEAVGYRLLDHRSVGTALPDWSVLRTVPLPALQSLTASQALQVREEAEKALPAFRAKLQLDLVSLKDLSDEEEEKRAREIAAELRLAARDLQGQLTSISLSSLRRKEKLFVALATALEIIAVGSKNSAAIFAASGTFAAAMIAAHQTHRDRRERHEVLVHQPAYVLLTAERIHEASR
jgi:hypothetical protein